MKGSVPAKRAAGSFDSTNEAAGVLPKLGDHITAVAPETCSLVARHPTRGYGKRRSLTNAHLPRTNQGRPSSTDVYYRQISFPVVNFTAVRRNYCKPTINIRPKQPTTRVGLRRHGTRQRSEGTFHVSLPFSGIKSGVAWVVITVRAHAFRLFIFFAHLTL